MSRRSEQVAVAARWLLPLVAVGLAVVALRSRLPRPEAIIGALHGASPFWLAVAVVAEVVSLDMFARQQRRLLAAFGVRMSQSSAVALTYSRSAITYAVPAGSAVSAGFAFGQFRARGASRTAATAVTVLSGLASTLGLVAVFLVGALSQLPVAGATEALGAAAAVGGVVWWRRRRAPVAAAPVEVPAVVPDGLVGRARAAVVGALREARRVPRRHWYAAVALAALNWLTDMVCLVAVARSVHLPLGMLTLGGAYLAVQLVRQVPLTPGGVGLVETSLLAALVSAGAGQAPAAAAVLGYRLLSCWLIIPVGLVAWFALRRRPAATPQPATAQVKRYQPVRVIRRVSGSTYGRGSYGPRMGYRPRSYSGAIRRPATRSV